MFRSGYRFDLGQPQILELSKEEVKVFEDDWRFKVSSAKAEKSKVKKGASSESETVLSADSDSTEEAVTSEAEIVEDSLVTQEEISGSEDTLETLLKTYSREELNELALGNKIENPENFANKTEVAQAILDAS